MPSAGSSSSSQSHINHKDFAEYQPCWRQIAHIRSSTTNFLEGLKPLFVWGLFWFFVFFCLVGSVFLFLTVVTKDGIWAKTESHTQTHKYVLP